MVDELAKARIPFGYHVNWLNLKIVKKKKHEGGHGPVVTLEIPKHQIFIHHLILAVVYASL